MNGYVSLDQGNIGSSSPARGSECEIPLILWALANRRALKGGYVEDRSGESSVAKASVQSGSRVAGRARTTKNTADGSIHGFAPAGSRDSSLSRYSRCNPAVGEAHAWWKVPTDDYVCMLGLISSPERMVARSALNRPLRIRTTRSTATSFTHCGWLTPLPDL